ncbi:hypothetical protein NMY22_g11808 [Coprinellus aureogranulatus]|nr:hypothetical protein NMY22_g11808 [Coprinellus aureogranulatus]
MGREYASHREASKKGLCLVHGGKPNTSITVVRPDADFDPHLIHGCASRTSTQEAYSYLGDQLTFHFQDELSEEAPTARLNLSISFVRPDSSLLGYIDSIVEIHEEEWTEVFGRLPMLKKVTFNTTPFFTFCTALRAGPALSTLVDCGSVHSVTPCFQLSPPWYCIDLTFRDTHTTIESTTVLVDALNSRPEMHRITLPNVTNSEYLEDNDYAFIVASVPYLTVDWDELGDGHTNERREDEEDGDASDGEESEEKSEEH